MVGNDKLKDAFIDSLKGDPVARDKFGTIIGKDDYVIFGTGSQAAADLNFGKVVKINYKMSKAKEKERVSSVTVRCIDKYRSWRYVNNDAADKATEIKGYIVSPRKRAFQSFSSSWVTDTIPDWVKELLDEDE